MRKSRPSERGSALVEFVLCFALIWTPLILGLYGIGFNLNRAMQVTQVCRTAAHMSAFGTDFSKPAFQTLLVNLAPSLHMTTTGGNGVLILSTITYADQTACDNAKLSGQCSNKGSAVVIRRIVIGNAALHASSFGVTDGVTDGSGNIDPSVYLTNPSLVAPNFLNLISLQSSSQLAYMAEFWVTSPDFAQFNTSGWNGGSSARAIF